MDGSIAIDMSLGISPVSTSVKSVNGDLEPSVAFTACESRKDRLMDIPNFTGRIAGTTQTKKIKTMETCLKSNILDKVQTTAISDQSIFRKGNVATREHERVLRAISGSDKHMFIAEMTGCAKSVLSKLVIEYLMAGVCRELICSTVDSSSLPLKAITITASFGMAACLIAVQYCTTSQQLG